MKIDFDGIQAFVAVAELGGFGKAARALHITQTALTRRIQKLEAYLGLQLLNRTTRSVELTPVGQTFLPQARAMVMEMRSAVEQLKDMSRSGRGDLSLACIPSLSAHGLPELLRRYAQSHPDNRVRVIDAASPQVRAAVIHGEAELGIALRDTVQPELKEAVLFSDPLMLVCPTPHPLQDRASVRWSDLRHVDLIGVSSLTATRLFMDHQLARQGIRLQVRYEVQHHATALNLVAAGLGCAVLPSSTFQEGDRPRMRKIPLVRPAVAREVVLVQSRRKALSPAAAAFQALVMATDLSC